MLKVQQYLRSGKTLADLTSELGINATAHPELPLVILNYDQIESPKTHEIVRECRGLILNSQNWEIVGKCMNRFFNWGEVADEMPLFNFNDFVVDSKEDGSLCILYNYNGQWHGNTRGSFGLDNMQFQDFSWRAGFLKAMGIESWNDLNAILDPEVTYICEFVSPWNKVVRTYTEPKMYLLAAFRKGVELRWDEVDALKGPFVRPERFSFKNIDEIIKFLQERSDEDKTFEGVVVWDGNWRWKVKSPTYLSLHKMRGEGDNLYNPKHLIPWVLGNEGDELLTYFPEVKEKYFEMKAKVDDAFTTLVAVWAENKDIEVQKDFALAIVGKTPFTGILFDLRKRFGKDQTLEQLKAEWRNYGDGIVKVMFKK